MTSPHDSSLWQSGFNVRVYGLLYSSDRQKLLFLEEVINGKTLMKFPGGGVEHKEGPGAALVREFKEELDLTVSLQDLVYVSPHLHRSIFRLQQLIGLYWEVNSDGAEPKPMAPKVKIHWLEWRTLPLTQLTHHLDREVLGHLRS